MISIRQEPPPQDTFVLAYVPPTNGAFGAWFIAKRSKDGTWTDDSRDCETLPTPSHWMELPATPTEMD